MKLRLVKQKDHVRRAFPAILTDHPMQPSVTVEVSSNYEDAALTVSRGLRMLVLQGDADYNQRLGANQDG